MGATQALPLTPAQAFAAVRKEGAPPVKSVWHLYADDDYYYVQDDFTGSSKRRAFIQGVQVDGRTGLVVPQKS